MPEVVSQASHDTRPRVERVEDAALLCGQGRYMDDLPVSARTAHMAILRSPHAHANLKSLDCSAALALEGVITIFTAKDYAQVAGPLMVGLKLAMECWPLAYDRVRYVGEPVAVVVASDRYIAEDALDLIVTDYEPLPAIVDPEEAIGSDAPVLHPGMQTNLCADRSFTYGDPDAAFDGTEKRVEITVRYPRNSCTPIETYGVIAEWHAHERAYDIQANFQGPFSLHPVVARALKVPGNRLRLRTPPDSGGSFGIKQGVFPYMALAAVAARMAGCPVKWVEDRLEHLSASVSATNRVIRLAAAVTKQGRITALDWDQLEDVGAYLRAPEPATLYRMHGNLTGAYAIPNMRVRNRIAVTNKTPTGLNRGFGGPQVYFALERLMQSIARELGRDPVEIIRTNLIDADAFPYRTASGALYDSGNYQLALDTALQDGGYVQLLKQREAARAEGRLYGIGLAAVVEPSVSNMGYLSTALTPEERARSGPKNGAQSSATIMFDPVGAVSVQLDSVPQGQGHKTVAAMIVAEVFGLDIGDVKVTTTLDTAKDAWSIASGNYSSRFAAASAGALRIAADRLKARLAKIAAAQLHADENDLVFAKGKIAVSSDAQKAISFGRIASTAHWAPGTLPEGAEAVIRETASWTPPELTAPDEDDHVNSSLCHGFIFDFCGIEIDQVTGAARIDKYVTMHDCGTILHEGMVEGQIRGGFAHAVGAALYEEYAYDTEGAFLAGTFADYPVPTVTEMPALDILHISTPSPFTPLGAKGVGEGNCMSTPACIANAVADALSPLGGDNELVLPLTPARLMAMMGDEPAAPEGVKTAPTAEGGRGMTGEGEARVNATPQDIWDLLMDADQLATIIPGAHSVRKISPTKFLADVTLGVGPVKGRYRAEVSLTDLDPPHQATLSGQLSGALGTGGGEGRVTLDELPEGGTLIRYTYEARVGGKVASVGGRLLDGAAKIVIGQFFQALGRKAGGGPSGWLARIKQIFGGGAQ